MQWFREEYLAFNLTCHCPSRARDFPPPLCLAGDQATTAGYSAPNKLWVLSEVALSRTLSFPLMQMPNLSLFVHPPPYQKAWMPPPVPPWIKPVNSCNECPPHSWKLGPSPQAVSHSILSYSRLGSRRPIQQHHSHSQAAAFPWSCNSCKFLDYEVCQRSNSCHIGWQQSTNTQLRRAGNRSLGTVCRRVSLDTLCWNETIAVHTYLLANYYGIFEVLTNLSVTT